MGLFHRPRAQSRTAPAATGTAPGVLGSGLHILMPAPLAQAAVDLEAAMATFRPRQCPNCPDSCPRDGPGSGRTPPARTGSGAVATGRCRSSSACAACTPRPTSPLPPRRRRRAAERPRGDRADRIPARLRCPPSGACGRRSHSARLHPQQTCWRRCCGSPATADCGQCRRCRADVRHSGQAQGVTVRPELRRSRPRDGLPRPVGTASR